MSLLHVSVEICTSSALDLDNVTVGNMTVSFAIFPNVSHHAGYFHDVRYSSLYGLISVAGRHVLAIRSNKKIKEIQLAYFNINQIKTLEHGATI